MTDRDLTRGGDVPPIPARPASIAPRNGHRRLWIGLVTADSGDACDAVWFAVQAIRLYHPEVADALTITILDRTPDGPCAADLRGLTDLVPHLTYLPLCGPPGPDLFPHETGADVEIVCLLNAHTLLPPGALASLLAWFDASPAGAGSHAPLWWNPTATPPPGTIGDAGRCGCWEPYAQRVAPAPPHASAGAFACRRANWPDIERHLQASGAAMADRVWMSAAQDTNAANPFGFFEGIFCLNLDRETHRWQAATVRYHALGIAARVERFPAIPTPDNHHRGCALSWRAMIAEAARRDYAHLLVFEDDAVFLDDTLAVVGAAVADLPVQEWDLCYLGAAVWSQQFPFVAGSAVLQQCGPVTCTHALAVHRRAYARLLADIPPEGAAFDAWLDRWIAIDQYLSEAIHDGTYRALITSPRVATQRELLGATDTDGALAGRYRI